MVFCKKKNSIMCSFDKLSLVQSISCFFFKSYFNHSFLSVHKCFMFVKPLLLIHISMFFSFKIQTIKFHTQTKDLTRCTASALARMRHKTKIMHAQCCVQRLSESAEFKFLWNIEVLAELIAGIDIFYTNLNFTDADIKSCWPHH